MDDSEQMNQQEAENYNALKTAMESPQGASLFTWLISLSNPNADAFNTNPLQMSYDLGKQAVGKELLRAMTIIDPTFIPKLQENQING